jgi:hypothetical protein
MAVRTIEVLHSTIMLRAPVLFLDFDGVLHPNLAAEGQMFSRAPLLEQALEGLHVDIVVSSSWRFQWELPHLRALLPAALQAKVRGVTGPAYVGRHARWHEINAYCAAKGVAHWRALDDAFFEFPKDCEQLILCEGGRGLEGLQCDRIRRWLLG